MAYLRTDVDDATSRPVTFIFNGGPGSASLWLHMGLFGPRLVQVDSEANVDDGAATGICRCSWPMGITI